MITRQGNFRIEPTASGAGFEVFSNNEKVRLLFVRFTGSPTYRCLESAFEINEEIFVFRAVMDILKDKNGIGIVKDGKDYGLVWNNVQLNGIVNNSENIVFSSGIIYDQKIYSYVAELVIDLLSDLRYVYNSPPVRRIIFSKFERYVPKIIEVVPQ